MNSSNFISNYPDEVRVSNHILNDCLRNQVLIILCKTDSKQIQYTKGLSFDFRKQNYIYDLKSFIKTNLDSDILIVVDDTKNIISIPHFDNKNQIVILQDNAKLFINIQARIILVKRHKNIISKFFYDVSYCSDSVKLKYIEQFEVRNADFVRNETSDISVMRDCKLNVIFLLHTLSKDSWMIQVEFIKSHYVYEIFSEISTAFDMKIRVIAYI